MNHDIKKKLGEGPQGAVYLVEDSATKELCVMKKVECRDEPEASEAFKEAALLGTLTHPSLSGYREFFVTWDAKDCAVYMCIVMDYYKEGDLSVVLKTQRQRQECIDHTLLMQWAGQLIGTLVYMHQKGIVHRNLKPANVFIHSDSLVIGDFGVATLMESTRSATGSVVWLAPEALDKMVYAQQSDVWSLGCILLEMATCGFLDSNTIRRVLLEAKHDRTLLDAALARVEEDYGPGLSGVVYKTLKKEYKQRPTSMQLSELPYVQQCLRLCHSYLYKESEVDTEVGPSAIPDSGGVGALLEYSLAHHDSVGCQILVLRLLLQQHDLAQMGLAGKLQLVNVLKVFVESEEVQHLACLVLAQLAATADLELDGIISTEDFIKLVCLALRSHSGSKNVHTSASALLMAISSDQVAASVLGGLKGVQAILSAMRAFPEDLEIVSNCVTVILSLSMIDSNMKNITKERGVRDVCNAMVTHMSSRYLVDAACSVLWSLSLEVENVMLMTKLSAVELLLKVMDKYSQESGVVRCVCSTLCLLSEVHEVSAHLVIQTNGGLSGIPIISKAADSLPSNGEVVESIASLIESLSYYDVLREELLSLDAVDLLTRMSLTFASADSKGSSKAAVSTGISNALVALTGFKAGQSDSDSGTTHELAQHRGSIEDLLLLH